MKNEKTKNKKAKGTVAAIRRKKLLFEPIDVPYLSMRGKELVTQLFFYSIIIGLCFAILYPLIKVIPVVLNDFSQLDNPDVIWIPIKFSTLSFTAAIRFAFGNGSTMLLTLLYCTVITGIQILISALAGYPLGRVNFPFKSVVMALVIITIVVPPQALLISQFLRFKQFDVFGIISLFNNGKPLDLINKPYTLYILAMTGFGVKQSIFVFIFRQFFKGLPLELEEAAFIDGCGFYKTFFKIAFPNAIPAIMTVGVLAFVWNYGDTYYTGYFNPSGPYLANTLKNTFAFNNMQNVLNAVTRWYNVPGATSFTFDAIKHAAAILYLSPLLVLYFIAQRRIVENFERSGIVG